MSADAPRPADTELHLQVDTLLSRNNRLARLLKESREQMAALKGEVERLGNPPNGYGTLIRVNDDDTTAEVMVTGKRMRLTLGPGTDAGDFTPGCTVRLNEALTVVDTCTMPSSGTTATVKALLPDGIRARVATNSDDELVLFLPLTLRPGQSGERIRAGDSVLCDSKNQFIIEKILKPEVEALLLEQTPDVSYEDIGGLSQQLEYIRDAVELPFTHSELYAQFDLAPPKGVLLYGPPGCGKTLIAKAVATSLAARATTGDPTESSAYFLSIKGPELLNKYVGESERHIRLLFQRAREKASEGNPVIIFFDEMDSIFRVRGSGVSSDVETTIVPQLLAELDGVEDLKNVIVIGASNREDMIDPALLRPGRLDIKIRIERPNHEESLDILSKYLHPGLRFDTQLGEDTAAIAAMLSQKTIDYIFQQSPRTAVATIHFSQGPSTTLHIGDLSSGAMLKNIVDRAKTEAIKSILDNSSSGLNWDHLRAAVDRESHENADLPSSSTPAEWAKVAGIRHGNVIAIDRHNR